MWFKLFKILYLYVFFSTVIVRCTETFWSLCTSAQDVYSGIMWCDVTRWAVIASSLIVRAVSSFSCYMFRRDLKKTDSCIAKYVSEPKYNDNACRYHFTCSNSNEIRHTTFCWNITESNSEVSSVESVDRTVRQTVKNAFARFHAFRERWKAQRSSRDIVLLFL